MPKWEPLAGAVLAALALVFFADRVGDVLMQDIEVPASISPMAPSSPGPVEPQVAGGKPQPPKKCVACHSFGKGEANKIGPNLWGIAGRAVASAPGYAYSDGLKALGGSWTPERLDTFIKGARKMVPDSKMTFSGIPDDAERRGVVAYLGTLK